MQATAHIMRAARRRRLYFKLRLAALACGAYTVVIGPGASLAAEDAPAGVRPAGVGDGFHPLADRSKDSGHRPGRARARPALFDDTPKPVCYGWAPPARAKGPKGAVIQPAKAAPATLAKPTVASRVIATPSPDIVEQVQAALTGMGLYSGRVDGVLAPDINDAIAAYQEEQGLPATGKLDTVTIAKLGLGTP